MGLRVKREAGGSEEMAFCLRGTLGASDANPDVGVMEMASKSRHGGVLQSGGKKVGITSEKRWVRNSYRRFVAQPLQRNGQSTVITKFR